MGKVCVERRSLYEKKEMRENKKEKEALFAPIRSSRIVLFRVFSVKSVCACVFAKGVFEHTIFLYKEHEKKRSTKYASVDKLELGFT